MNVNLFGTDGIRGTFGTEPLTIESIIRFGQTLAQWAQSTLHRKPLFLIAHDTRISCSLVKSALKTGLLLYSVEVYDAHILPSPAILQIINNDNRFDFGIIISASHNQYQDNGIKIVQPRLGKLSLDQEHEISQLFYHITNKTDYRMLGTEQFFSQAGIRYERTILSMFLAGFLTNKKVVLDCANGATYEIAPRIFRSLGAQVISYNTKPNGYNINKNSGSLQPEQLQSAVNHLNADMGFAFDGDGDRVIAVSRSGDIKNGDDMLALLLTHPEYHNTNTIVGTIMSNMGLEKYLLKRSISLQRTHVGDKHVASAMMAQDIMLGGEPSGHIIFRNYLNTGDGIFTALKVAETMHLTGNWDFITYQKLPQIHMSIPVLQKKDLSQPPFSSIIASCKSELTAGRLVVRYSGTEPILRIMIEDNDSDNAQSLCTQLSKKLQEKL